MIKSIRHINDKDEHHGYLELRNYDNILLIRVNFKNDNEVGYEEWHNVKRTSFYIR